MIGQTNTVYKGVITGVDGPATGDPATIKYTAIAVMTDDVVTVTPAQLPANRYWRAQKIIAAAIDSPCTIQVIGNQVRLYDVQEGIPTEDCPPGGGSPGATGGRAFGFDLTMLAAAVAQHMKAGNGA